MMRRGLLLFLFTVLISPTLQAGLFDNREQQAAKLFEKGKYDKAAREFTDDYRRGVAQYRAGQYAQAAESFQEVDRKSVRTQALYNLGNSRVRSGELGRGIAAYLAAARLLPRDQDVQANLDYAERAAQGG